MLARVETSKYGPATISLGELEQWCLDHSCVPNEDEEPFIVDYKFIYENGDGEEAFHSRQFRFLVSSKTLLKNASHSRIACADGTYKLVWQGYPVLMIGTTDRDRHFHSFGLAVCSNEEIADFKFMFDSVQSGVIKINYSAMKAEVLISDAADAIRNGFSQSFNCDQMIMCWAHMRRAVVKKIEAMVPKEMQQDMIVDIDML